MSKLFLIFIGGGLGSLARFGIGKWFEKSDASFFWGTFISNLIACFILGLGLALLERKIIPVNISPLLLVGFCGGFSTYSTFTFEMVELISTGKYQAFFVYFLASLIICTLGFILGYRSSALF